MWSSPNSRRPVSESAYLVVNQAYISLRISNASNASHTRAEGGVPRRVLLGGCRDCLDAPCSPTTLATSKAITCKA